MQLTIRLLSFLLLPLAANAHAQRNPDRGIHRDTAPYFGESIALEDAARFLSQATFGPSFAEITALPQEGFEGWLNRQMDSTITPVSLEVPYLEAVQAIVDHDGNDSDGKNGDVDDLRQRSRMEAWWRMAIGGVDPLTMPPASNVHVDQLRQRVAFALSEIFVVSDANGGLSNQPYALASYNDMLARNAFGNYRQLLEEVTLHPAMGVYLSMLRNRKPDATENISPDENYAREAMQLFSIGLDMINLDGSLQLNGLGQPVPTYSQDTIQGFAHVYTGWSFAGCEFSVNVNQWMRCAPRDRRESGWQQPMRPYLPQYASEEDKQLLVYPGVSLAGGVLPAGGDAQSDLDLALDNIFNHPNVGPFIARRLIQRLVTSNPSPAYIARVASVFNDDDAGPAQGTRGNLGAVVRAILLDPEARSGHIQAPTTFGKLREPLLRLSHLWRAMDAASVSGRIQFAAPEQELNQAPLRAHSVFNFFMPDYAQPGEVDSLGLVSPEFQILSETSATDITNALDARIYLLWQGGPDASPDQLRIDVMRDADLAADVDALIDRYDLTFLSGQMSPSLRQRLHDYLVSLPGTSSDERRLRVQEALYLINTSAEYAVQK